MRSIKIEWRSVWVRSLGIALGWQAFMTIAGYLLERHFAANPSAIGWLGHTAHWDGGWFLSIITGNGYVTNGAAPVFYPLFPLAVLLVQAVSFHALGVLSAALLINTVALWLAIVALVRIAEAFDVGRHKWLMAALFLTFPTALFLHFFYAEALFCALAFWAYLFALRRQWLRMAILLSLLMIVKIPALLVIGLCALEFMRAHDWSIKRLINPRALVFALVPLGFVAYGLYLQAVRGDFLGMVHGYHMTTDWSYHKFNPFFPHTIIRACGSIVYKLFGANSDAWWVILINAILPLLALGLLALASLYCIIVIRGKTLPLGIAGLVSIVFFTINNNVVSVHRYVLPCLVVYLVPLFLLRAYGTRKWLPAALGAMMVTSVVMQAVLYVFFVSGRFAG